MLSGGLLKVILIYPIAVFSGVMIDNGLRNLIIEPGSQVRNGLFYNFNSLEFVRLSPTCYTFTTYLQGILLPLANTPDRSMKGPTAYSVSSKISLVPTLCYSEIRTRLSHFQYDALLTEISHLI